VEEFTEKEERIMELLLHGANITEIARILNIPHNQAKDLRDCLYNKLGVVNKVQASLLYIKLKNYSKEK